MACILHTGSVRDNHKNSDSWRFKNQLYIDAAAREALSSDPCSRLCDSVRFLSVGSLVFHMVSVTALHHWFLLLFSVTGFFGVPTVVAVAMPPLTNPPPRGALVFLHGLGDSPAGWSDLRRMLPGHRPRLSQLKYVFPAAPIIPIGINGDVEMPVSSTVHSGDSFRLWAARAAFRPRVPSYSSSRFAHPNNLSPSPPPLRPHRPPQ